MILPVYSQEYLLSLAPEWFAHPTQYKPGDARYLLGHVKADQVAQCSTFLVRISRRRARTVLRTQAMQHGSRALPKYYWRTEYVVASQSYALCSIAWADGAITVRQEFSTLKQAKESRSCTQS